jgi:hypothetical protein
MSSKVAGNVWGEILHHEADGILELRWLPSNDRWRVQGDARAVCVGSGEGTAVVSVDRRDPVPTSVWSERDAMAGRLHHPALWRRRRKKICLPQ